MMQTPGARLPYGTAQTYHPAPNAALLIDFDNVTMGIRSDLGKELKSLLKSDVIRGKVAVQRAYADWRRYPQYIVPLTESSIDLIFAPAYGSSKKNATDLRMAIDAIELVFTRPEIGTFILMTGDSDFSSCVLKLKEYGKYVIGVGMRESSSDLLIQNCDEYYSYHSLYGMTRAGEVTESSEDPWVLVRRAVQQMSANNDVMRTDRLKQVMLDLDHGFDEKKVGYSKFSLFVKEAANKGLIRLRRGENGQQELLPVTGEEEGGEEQEATAQESSGTTSTSSSRGSRRGDGRRGREPRREPRTPRPEPIETAAVESAPAAEAAPRPETAAPSPSAPSAPAAPAARPAAPEPSPAVTVGDGAAGLAQAYALVQEAVRNLTSSSGARAVRDGDVKREMLRLAPGFDEESLGFSKFTRFLRQAHDAEVVDLNRASGGNYEVSLPSSGKRLPPPSLAAPDARVTPAAMAPPAPAQPEATEREKPVSTPTAAPAKPAEPPVAQAPAATPAATPPAGALRGRGRGRRGGVAEGIPPILPGQVIAPLHSVTAPAAPAAPVAAEPVAAAAPAEQTGGEQEERATKGRSRRGRRGGRGRGRGEAAAEPNVLETAVTADEAIPAPVEPAPAPAAEGTAVVESAVHTEPKRRTRQPRQTKEATEAKEAKEPKAAGEQKAPKAPRGSKQAKAEPAPQPAGFNPDSLGLPGGGAEVEAHLTAYKGVGKKTAEQLVATFGAGELFRALEETPERVREVLGDRRAKTVLDAWSADRDARTPVPVAEEAPARAKSRTRRGGRGRSTKKQSTPAE